MSLIDVLNYVYVNFLFVVVKEFISCIHFHLGCCRCSALWVSEFGLKCV
jgi:hypothetical protein